MNQQVWTILSPTALISPPFSHPTLTSSQHPIIDQIFPKNLQQIAHWNPIEIPLKSHWNHREIPLKSHWNHREIPLKSHWNPIESPWNPIEIPLNIPKKNLGAYAHLLFLSLQCELFENQLGPAFGHREGPGGFCRAKDGRKAWENVWENGRYSPILNRMMVHTISRKIHNFRFSPNIFHSVPSWNIIIPSFPYWFPPNLSQVLSGPSGLITSWDWRCPRSAGEPSWLGPAVRCCLSFHGRIKIPFHKESIGCRVE